MGVGKAHEKSDSIKKALAFVLLRRQAVLPSGIIDRPTKRLYHIRLKKATNFSGLQIFHFHKSKSANQVDAFLFYSAIELSASLIKIVCEIVVFSR